MQFVWIARRSAQLPFNVFDGGAVEEVPELLLPKELAQEVAVERQRLSAALRRRGVVLIHVRGDVVEEERGREDGGRRRLDVDDVDLARRDPAEQPLQRGQVEDVLQALAIRLEDNGEQAVAARHLQQRLRLQALLPERRPLAGPPPRDQERPRGVLAEARAEEGRLPHFREHQLLDLVRGEQQLGQGRRR